MRIGYIGLGNMGGALARRLLLTHPLVVWDLDKTAAAALRDQGAIVADSAAALARECDIVLLCLPRSSDVRRLVFGPGGLAEGLSAGKLVIDQTSGVPGETRAIAVQLHGRGVAVIDAPVSGGVMGAAAGTIAIMVSGEDAHYARALPVLEAISPNVFRCGVRVGDGQAMKLVNNLLSAGCRVATLEVLAMGRKQGLTLAAMTDAINKGSARNRTSKVTLQDIVEGKSTPLFFAMSLMLKDMDQAVRLGMECGAPTTLANLVRGLLQIGVNTLGADVQYDRILELIGSMADTHIADGSLIAGGPAADDPSVAAAKNLQVGYVGLGTMGGALVRRMMLSRSMQVFDARAEVVRAFEAEGAVALSDLPSLARACDVVFVCLPTSDIVREVVFGKGGLAEGLSPGKIIVDQTTGDPAISRAIAVDLEAQGVQWLDAPIAGGARGAVTGTLAIMVGGPQEAYTKVRPLLASVSPNIVYCGAAGNGHVAKLVSNAVSGCNVLLTYEAATIAVKYGLKLSVVATVINKSTGCSAASERILPSLSEGRATAGFQLQLMAKDLKLAGRLALECGAPMLIARTVCGLYEMGSHQLGGTTNIDAMAQLFESMADVRFVGA